MRVHRYKQEPLIVEALFNIKQPLGFAQLGAITNETLQKLQ